MRLADGPKSAARRARAEVAAVLLPVPLQAPPPVDRAPLPVAPVAVPLAPPRRLPVHAPVVAAGIEMAETTNAAGDRRTGSAERAAVRGDTSPQKAVDEKARAPKTRTPNLTGRGRVQKEAGQGGGPPEARGIGSLIGRIVVEKMPVLHSFFKDIVWLP